jgi:hypothetical protein
MDDGRLLGPLIAHRWWDTRQEYWLWLTNPVPKRWSAGAVGRSPSPKSESALSVMTGGSSAGDHNVYDSCSLVSARTSNAQDMKGRIALLHRRVSGASPHSQVATSAGSGA